MRTEPKILGQACHILKSYLHSLMIPYKAGDEDLLVTAKDGSSVRVRVSTRTERTPSGTVHVSAKDMTCPDLERIIETFHAVTEAAGYGRPLPVNRGSAPSGKVTYRDHFELVYLRHQLFRRTPTPADMSVVETLLPYIKRIAIKAFYRYQYVLNPMGFTEDDLVSIGRVHAMCYVHSYADDLDSTSNIKLFTEFLNQRFAELAKIVGKKGKNATCQGGMAGSRGDNWIRHAKGTTDNYVGVLEDSLEDEASADADDEYEEGTYTLLTRTGSKATLEVRNDGFLGIELYVDGRLLTRSGVDDFREALNRGDFVLAPNTETEKQPTQGQLYRRQVNARAALHERFNAMDPERREIVLTHAALAKTFPVEAQQEARRLCRELACPQCSKSVVTGTICKTCSVEAKPRYGVDFVAVHARLSAERDSLVYSMGLTNDVANSKVGKTKASVKEVGAVSALEGPPVTPEQIAAADAAMKTACYATLPEKLKCSVCNDFHPKAEFGTRIPRRHPNGMPKSAVKQSRCIQCRNVVKTH